MDLITAHYKTKDELLVINLEQMVCAMPRIGTGNGDEEEGVIYTSFLMTARVGGQATLDTLLRYDQFLDMMQVAEDEPNEEGANGDTTPPT